jgi:hypothetical protein
LEIAKKDEGKNSDSTHQRSDGADLTHALIEGLLCLTDVHQVHHVTNYDAAAPLSILLSNYVGVLGGFALKANGVFTVLGRTFVEK